MKKSQLRKLIRESIKTLMTEQQSNYSCHDFVTCWSMNNNPLANSFFVDYGAYVNLFNAQVAAGNSPGNNPVGWQVISDASTAAWQAMGSPNVYDVVGGNIKFVQGTPFDMCFKYLGTSPCAGQQAYLEYITSPSITPAQQGSCQICQTQLTSPVSGCTDSQASNFDPNATQDDGSCDYGWTCGPLPMGGAVAEQSAPMPTGCIPGTSTNIGQYATQGACLSQNTNIPNGCGGTSIGMKKSDPQIDRMQDLAFRGKK